MFPGINTKRELDTLLEPKQTPLDPRPNSEGDGKEQRFNPDPSGNPNQFFSVSSPIADTSITTRLVRQVRLAELARIRPEPPHIDTNDDDSIWDTASSMRQGEPRYHGLSSSIALSRDAGMLRNGYHSGSILSNVRPTRRRQFWQPTAPEMRYLSQSPWETEEGLSLELPPDDLMPIIIDAFFSYVFFPFIHRPMFEKQLKEGLHRRNGTFLRVVLMVCANGAKWCNDPRVLDDRWPVSLSAGHRWFRQLEPGHKNFIDQISLHDAQLVVVSVSSGIISVSYSIG